MIRRGFVYRLLVRWPVRYLGCGVVFAALGLFLGLLVVLDLVKSVRGQTLSEGDLIFALILSLPGLAGLALVVLTLRELVRPPDRHPAVLALARYGDPRQVVAAVDAEMARPWDVVRIGHRLRSFAYAPTGGGDTYTAEAYLTRSWLVCLTGGERDGRTLFRSDGDRLTIFRLNDIVLASRVPAPPTPVLFAPVRRYDWVAVIDRHGVRLDMPFREPDAVRLLAEVLGRVPWVVNRFDPDSPHAPGADPGHFVAEADRRREEFRLTGRTPPTSPS
jgi:hypothetical protein